VRPALALPLSVSWSASAASQAKPAFEMSAGDLEDRSRGCLCGRIFGDLSGLPIEMKKENPRDWKETRGHIEEKHTDHGRGKIDRCGDEFNRAAANVEPLPPLAESERLRKDRPNDWNLALEELKMFPKVWRRIYDAPQPQVARIQAAARAEGRPQKPGK